MKAINHYIIVETIKEGPKKIAGLIMTEETEKQKAAMKKFAEFKPTSRVGTADYDKEINKASAELARVMGATSATGKKYTRKKRRTRRTKKKADGK